MQYVSKEQASRDEVRVLQVRSSAADLVLGADFQSAPRSFGSLFARTTSASAHSTLSFMDPPPPPVAQEALDERLAQRQARDTGLCPVRGELYRQAFGEAGHMMP